jgi:hypothetical protein
MRQRGQASMEYLALVAVVAAVLTAAALAIGLPNTPDSRVRSPNAVREAYGEETEAVVRRYAPGIAFERGIPDAPVDPRRCRRVACAIAARPVLFTHVLRRGATTYVQYWAYWADSSWHGVAGRHADDWESFQVRIEPDGGAYARASAHHGYTGRRFGSDLNVNQLRPALVPRRFRRGWVHYGGWYRVAAHSHAGFVSSSPGEDRATPAGQVQLVPIETAAGLPELYAISPPWRKTVYRDPESAAT